MNPQERWTFWISLAGAAIAGAGLLLAALPFMGIRPQIVDDFGLFVEELQTKLESEPRGDEKQFYYVTTALLSLKNRTDRPIEIRVSRGSDQDILTVEAKSIERQLIRLEPYKSTVLEIRSRQKVEELGNEAFNNISRKTNDIHDYIRKNRKLVENLEPRKEYIEQVVCYDKPDALKVALKNEGPAMLNILLSFVSDYSKPRHCAIGMFTRS